MNSNELTYDDCCLLSNIILNSERISYLLECRFKSNSIRTSFDFKSFLPEQPSNNAKVSRSLLKLYPIRINSNNNDDESISSESSDEEIEEISSPKLSFNVNNDDYLDNLAEWEPNQQRPIVETDDEEEVRNDIQAIIHDNTHADAIDMSAEIPTTEVEDLLVTFIHLPVKTEPLIYDNTDLIPPQLDGQTDTVSDNNNPEQSKHINENKNLENVIAKIKLNTSKPNKVIEINNVPQRFDTSRITHNNKKKTSNQPRQKPTKKIIPPPLLSPLLKTNEEFIRPLDKRNRLPTKKKTINNKIHSQRTHNPEKSEWEHMILGEQKLNTFRSIKTNDFIRPIDFPINLSKHSESVDSSVEKNTNKRKRLNSEFNHQLQTKRRSPMKSKKRLSMEHNGKTILDYFKVVNRSSNNNDSQYLPDVKQQTNQMKSPSDKRKRRSATYFDGCITIDDDDDDDNTKISTEDNDIQEIQRKSYSISNNIYIREKLLDHAIHSPSMRVKWLLNLELLLLEHISICHQENIRPSNNFYTNPLIKYESIDNPSSYHINSSFISIIIVNFLKMFIIRHSNHHEEELSFSQFSLTSYLRYLLLELPTYNHIDENNCQQCHDYSLILHMLFDLLFDLIEYDLCEISTKEKYRSSLIEDDYFNQFLPRKTILKKPNQFERIKLIIYFIELIGLHRNKCPNKNEFFFHINENKIFQWIEDFIRHIVYQINNLIDERISICLNVMELCILFATERENRVKQMALFLAKLCEENSKCLQAFLFDENLLVDIRLLLINELIWKKFNIKFISMDRIDEVFRRIQIALTPPNPIDDMSLLLIRSLFNTYADLMIDIKHSVFIYSTSFEQITSMLRNQLELIYVTVMNLSNDSTYFEQIKRTVIFFRLIKCKWNRL